MANKSIKFPQNRPPNQDPRFLAIVRRSEHLQKSFWESIHKSASPKEVQTALVERMFFEIAFLQTTIAELKGILTHGTAEQGRNDLINTNVDAADSKSTADAGVSDVSEKMD